MLKPRIGPAICGRRNGSTLGCTTELRERFTRNHESLSRLAGFMLVVNCQLLVSFIPFLRVSHGAFPKFARAGKVPIALCQSRERGAGSTIGFDRQRRDKRL